MKNFLLLFSFSLLCGMVTAQTAPKWQWLVGGGSNYRGKNANTSDKHDHLVSMAIDDSANVYLAGRMVEDTKWAGVNYTFPQFGGTYSNPTLFISKYSAC